MKHRKDQEMGNYYYIKFKPLKYEDEPYYLCMGNNIHKAPIPLKIFDDIGDAIECKQDMLSDESYQATYMFEYYEISIERL